MPTYSHFSDRAVRRFAELVDRSGECWVLSSRPRPDRYGQIMLDGRMFLAHRAAWIIANGAIPEQTEVCHTCDNPPCVRPDHLFLGSHTDNMADMARKGRANNRPVVGEAHHSAKLTADGVREIRRLLAAGVARQAIARRYGVAPSQIYNIATGKTWRHVDAA